ncbi:MAG: NTP transferase domain-containing protein [Fimbriimonadaceae bacterium]
MNENWGLVVPAGGLVKDPLATALGTPRKALAVIGGSHCVVRTIDAAHSAGFRKIAVVSGEDVREVIGDDYFVMEGAGQIENAKRGVEFIEGCDRILFMPADTPFLKPESIQHFVEAVEKRIVGTGDHWFAAGLCQYKTFLEILPGFEHPHIKLKDGDYMSGAFYATSRAGFFQAAEQFRGFSDNRKNQLKMLMQIGIWPLIKYVFHQVSMTEAEQRLGKFFGGTAVVVPDCDPWSMADIDTVDEYQRLVTEAGQGS